MVIKAVAQGIINQEEETTVAIKMVKHKMDNNALYTLVSELKILTHIGRHLNIVNLLGAITQNVTKSMELSYYPFL